MLQSLNPTVLPVVPALVDGRRLTADKIASVAARVGLAADVIVSLKTFKPRPGDVIAVRTLTENPKYDRLELTTGRQARLNLDDVVIGVVGARRALRGYVGDVPSELAVGDELHLLNMGGVIGRCSGYHQEFGPAIKLEYLGAVVQDGQRLNIADFSLKPVNPASFDVPIIAVCGSSMHSGKTRAASELVRRFVAKGYRVAAGKLSGVACMKDTLEMRDNGAIATLSFADLGLPSTVGIDDLGWVARSVIGHLCAAMPDVVIVELGDGLLGGYNVGSILDEPLIRQSLAATVYCAGDFVAAWGGVELLKHRHLVPDVISGSVTDSKMGTDFIRQELGLPAANAVTSGATLFSIVESRVLAAAERESLV